MQLLRLVYFYNKARITILYVNNITRHNGSTDPRMVEKKGDI